MRKFPLQDALCLAFCACFIVITRGAFRLHLNIPGHAMFFTMFFMILGRGCVPRLGAATLVGLVAGLLTTLLGMGKGGPLIILKFLLPSLVVDLTGLFFPKLAKSYLLCAVTGALGSASRFLSIIAVEWMVGVDWDIMLQHALISSASGVIFGTVGSIMVPPIVRRLSAHGLIG
ncbi:MAG: hypothetical protein K9L83_09890 [Deltaproteobacteria bacterium]|nr:hypothetical protein [Deltaproteobacteria bacterium]